MLPVFNINVETLSASTLKILNIIYYYFLSTK